MQSAYKSFTHMDSYARMGEILDASDTSFPEVDSIPDRDKLTYTNGYYVNCSALFIDIRGSSNLPTLHKRPTLAKLYRVYLSEVVAVMNDNVDCREVKIVGDSVSGIFDTPWKSKIDGVFDTAAKLSSLIDIMNYKFKKVGISEIQVGIGMDWGRALMIKAGYKGSGINDVVWMGDVVNRASNLCSYGSRSWSDYRLMVSSEFYNNLNSHNQSLLSWNSTTNCYHGNVVDTAMNDWLEAQKKSNSQSSSSSYWRF